MQLQILTQDCSELEKAGAGRVWMCRLLRPTLGKKLLLVFALLAATGVANFLAIETLLGQMRGMTALVNVTGSLRWLSQRIQLDTLRIVRGDARERAAVDADLARLGEAIRSLEGGGSAQGIAIRGLPDELLAEIATVRLASVDMGRHAGQALAGQREAETAEHLVLMRAQGDRILNTADAIAARLTRESQRVEGETMDKLLRLGLLDLAILVAVLLAVRLRAVYPLRKLASVSRLFARGRREVRSGFRSLDEIGQLAAAFDGMADQIERDLRELADGAAEIGKREQGLRKFALTVEHSPVSVMITGADGAIEYVNPKFTETTGYAPEEAIGRLPSLLKSGQTPPQVYAELWRTLKSGREWHGELLNRRKSGELFWEDTSIAPVHDDGGRITHFVAVKEDVTARRSAQEAATSNNAELERRVAERTRQLADSNRELEAFSYSISHDLRAPLRGINGFAGLMLESCSDCPKTEPHEYLGRIRRATVRMGNLIDDMLDLSRLARSSIRPKPLDLSAMAISILEDRVSVEPGRAVRIEVEEGLRVEADETLLQAALENLLGNAWKFTAQRNPAQIAFGCREEGGQGGERVFFVRDNGAGFDMQFAGKLFGAFQRLHKPEEFEGNGIGLAMVQRIVGLHGGRIWAEAVPGEGATFYFTLGSQGLPGGADHA